MVVDDVYESRVRATGKGRNASKMDPSKRGGICRLTDRRGRRDRDELLSNIEIQNVYTCGPAAQLEHTRISN